MKGFLFYGYGIAKEKMRMKADEAIEMFYHFPIDRLWSGIMDDELFLQG